jgi:uncharacterized protein (DUF1330 family)
MQPILKTTLAGGLGLLLGAAGSSMLRAETAPPQAYLIDAISGIKDPELYKQYQAKAPATLEGSGGRAIVRRAAPVVLDKRGPVADTVTVLLFPSMKALTDWYNSPAYSAIRPLRENALDDRLYALEGAPPQ